jgi:hypothetical protein
MPLLTGMLCLGILLGPDTQQVVMAAPRGWAYLDFISYRADARDLLCCVDCSEKFGVGVDSFAHHYRPIIHRHADAYSVEAAIPFGFVKDFFSSSYLSSCPPMSSAPQFGAQVRVMD